MTRRRRSSSARRWVSSPNRIVGRLIRPGRCRRAAAGRRTPRDVAVRQRRHRAFHQLQRPSVQLLARCQPREVGGQHDVVEQAQVSQQVDVLEMNPMVVSRSRAAPSGSAPAVLAGNETLPEVTVSMPRYGGSRSTCPTRTGHHRDEVADVICSPPRRSTVWRPKALVSPECRGWRSRLRSCAHRSPLFGVRVERLVVEMTWSWSGSLRRHRPGVRPAGRVGAAAVHGEVDPAGALAERLEAADMPSNIRLNSPVPACWRPGAGDTPRTSTARSG